MTIATFRSVGDCALLVEFGETVSDFVNQQVITLDRALAEADIAGLQEVVPALVNLLILFDPIKTDHATIRASVEAMLPLPMQQEQEVRHHEVPVCFDPALTPDLIDVAETCGLTVVDVIEALAAAPLKVAMYGFAPGYAYLTGVPERLHVPRKPTPTPNVPKGSVMIAGAQSIVTPLTMPTGWCIIGRSPFEVMQTAAETAFRFNVGDTVQYCPVGRDALPSEMLIA